MKVEVRLNKGTQLGSDGGNVFNSGYFASEIMVITDTSYYYFMALDRNDLLMSVLSPQSKIDLMRAFFFVFLILSIVE